MMSCNWTSSTESYDNVTSCTDLDVDDDDDDLADLRHHLEVIRFVVHHVLAPTIITVGILANILTVTVLTRRSMAWSSTNIYLSALAVYDAVYLALAFSMTWNHYDTLRAMPWYVRYRLPVGRPLTDSASNTAVWLTVTFTVERFIGVRFPMKGKVWCTPRRAIYVVLVVCVTALLITLPEFFEYVAVEQSTSTDIRSNYSTADPSEMVLRPDLTEFGASAGYQLGYSYVNQILFTFLPLILLFVFNSLLVKAVLSAARLRRAMTGTATRDSTRSTDHEATEHRITVMLISVVVVFLVCQLPQAIQKLYSVYLLSTPGEMTTARQLRLKIGGNFCNLLVIINSAVNFLLYSALSANFRRTFKQTFCCYDVTGQSRRRHTASVIGTVSVPMANILMTDRDHSRRHRQPRMVSTDCGDDHVTAETSGHSRALLDGAVNG